MLESVQAFLEQGWRVTVSLPTSKPLTIELRGRGVDVTTGRTAILSKNALRPSGFIRLLADTAAGVWTGWKLISKSAPRWSTSVR